MFSAAEKHAEAVREIAMRERLYPRWIANGAISKQQADHRIAIMREVADDYRRLAETERLI
jgi:hypothetical protein